MNINNLTTALTSKLRDLIRMPIVITVIGFTVGCLCVDPGFETAGKLVLYSLVQLNKFVILVRNLSAILLAVYTISCLPLNQASGTKNSD